MSKFDAILAAKPLQKTDKAKKTIQKSVEQEKPDVLKRIGKRSHPDYTQITAYILKQTHEQVMRKIYKQREFSELVEELLADWLEKAE